MKKTFALTVSLIALAAPAFAGSPDEALTEPYVVAPAEDIWAGAYGGVSFSNVTGGVTENDAGRLPDLEDDTSFGAFVGYNWQKANFVYGGELNFTGFETAYEGFPNSFQENNLELRARAGYAVSNVLPYAFVGYAMSDLDDVGTVFEQSGIAYGLGVDVLVKEKFILGAEYSKRAVSGDASGVDIETTIDMLSLRLGYKF